MTQILIVLFILLGVFLDQISKYLVVIYMELGQSIDIIPGVLRLTYIHNKGAAFGSMAGNRWVFMVLSSIAIVAIMVFIFWKKPKSKLMLASLAMICAGGIGNMIDRVRLGYVIDFIDFCAFPKLWMWIFNIADAFVVVGAGVMILWMILDIIKDAKAQKTQALATNSVKARDGDADNGTDNETSNGDGNE